MLISYYANKKSSPRLPSWQPSLIFFNIPIESGSIIKPCTLKHFQVTYRLHKAGYWTILSQRVEAIQIDPNVIDGWPPWTAVQSCHKLCHYDDVIMTTMASQITSLTVVYPTVYSDADQRKHQSSASLAFVWGIIHRDRWIPRTKGQLCWQCFHLMTSSWPN